MSMSSPFAFLLCFFFFISSAHAFNITKILSEHDDFTNFENLLTQSGLAQEINQQHPVTVLVVSNGNTAVLSGLSNNVIKKVLSVHVILDYYDEKKLKKQQSKQAKTLTTLYQRTGEAKNQLGFLNMTNSGKGPTVFKSAAPYSHVEANLVKEVTTQPYNVSVLEVSNILNIARSIASSPTASHSQAPKASRSRKALTPAPADGPSDADNDDVSPSPPKSKTTKGEGEGDGDAADAPTPGTSSAVSVLHGDYLPSTVLMMLTWAWLLLAMV